MQHETAGWLTEPLFSYIRISNVVNSFNVKSKWTQIDATEKRRNLPSFQRRHVDVFRRDCRSGCCWSASVVSLRRPLRAAAAESADADEAEMRGAEVMTMETWLLYGRRPASTYKASPPALIAADSHRPRHKHGWLLVEQLTSTAYVLVGIWSVECVHNVPCYLRPPQQLTKPW